MSDKENLSPQTLVSNEYSLELNRIDKLATVRMPPMEPLEAAS